MAKNPNFQEAGNQPTGYVHCRSSDSFTGYQYHHPSKMSNSHPLRPYTAVGEIDHVHILSEHIGALMNEEEYSDVTFIVEKKRFPAHRVILAARCHYFRALLYGGMRESQPEAEIPLQDTTAEAFTMLLKYIYTGRATLRDEKEEVLLDFLSLAHKYGFPELEDSTSEYLCTILNIQNVCMTFDVASLYSLPKLTFMCCMFMDRNAQEVLSSEGFLSLSKVSFVCTFPPRNVNFNLNHVVYWWQVYISLAMMREALKFSPHRGLSVTFVSKLLKLKWWSLVWSNMHRLVIIIMLLKHSIFIWVMNITHLIGVNVKADYAIDILKTLRYLSKSYSYYIEVSMDELDWIRVIDHSKYLCRSWQNLYFPARVCRLV
ncbi:BTBD9 protein, partial [Furnarius figulus]|nr:BTBD9 protein [Furnarius figulus]